MQISWWQLVKSIPELRKAIAPIGESKDWYLSETYWAAIIKATFTLLSCFGIYVAATVEQIQTISIAIPLIIVPACSAFTSLAMMWLRNRSSTPISGTAASAVIGDNTIVLPSGTEVEDTTEVIKTAREAGKNVVVIVPKTSDSNSVK